MSQFLKNLLPRLIKHKDNLDLTEALVDKVWTIYGDNELKEYEFLRNGEIVITKNGECYDGTWRILGSGRLQLRTDFSNNLLIFDFSIMGILVMKISGNTNEPFLLYDPRIVKNGDLENYLNLISNGSLITPNSPENERFYRMFGPKEQKE